MKKERGKQQRTGYACGQHMEQLDSDAATSGKIHGFNRRRSTPGEEAWRYKLNICECGCHRDMNTEKHGMEFGT